MPAATFPRLFVPIRDLPSTERAALDEEFVARQVAILDARRRCGMNLILGTEDGRILRIAPDGTEEDVTAELDRTVQWAQSEGKA